jgi:IS30 family transposase
MKKYIQRNKEERYHIYAHTKAGVSSGETVKMIGRYKSVVYRE